MKTFWIVAIPLVLLAAAVGMLSHLEFSKQQTSDETSANTEVRVFTPSTVWRDVLKRVSLYYTAPSANQTSQQPVEKVVELTDAHLVGIVVTAPPQVYVVKPGTTEPISITIGDGWLTPWLLDQVHSDSVSWKNADTNEVRTQYLFQ